MVTGISLAHLKLRISEKFRKAKKAWHEDPHHHGTEEIPPPLPRSPASTKRRMRWPARQPRFTQVIGGHGGSTNTGSAVDQLGCPAPTFFSTVRTLGLAQPEWRRGRAKTGGVRVLLANTRWEKMFLKFLELSGVGSDGGRNR